MEKKTYENTKQEKGKDKLLIYLILVLIVAIIFAIIFIVFFKKEDVIAAVSIVLGCISIAVGIFAIIQSSKYNKQSSNLYDKMVNQLSIIEKAQEETTKLLSKHFDLINRNPSLSNEEKNRLGDEINEEIQSIKNVSRAEVGKHVEGSIESFYVGKGYAVGSDSYSGYTDLKAENFDKSLYFIYSLRTGLTVKNWPEELADSFFSSRYKTFFNNRKGASEYCVILMIYANVIYYCICNADQRTKKGTIDLTENSLMDSDHWLRQLDDAIEQFCRS